MIFLEELEDTLERHSTIRRRMGDPKEIYEGTCNEQIVIRDHIIMDEAETMAAKLEVKVD